MDQLREEEDEGEGERQVNQSSCQGQYRKKKRLDDEAVLSPLQNHPRLVFTDTKSKK